MKAFIDDAFTRLELLDPERHTRLAISRYPLDAIVAGVAIFEAKKRAGGLPEGVDARYLLGIVRNVQEQREGELTAELMLERRRDARDIVLDQLAREHAQLLEDELHGEEVLAALSERALLADRALDRTFWLGALADYVCAAPQDEREDRYQVAAQCIHATFRADPRRRQQAVRVIAERLLPLA